MRIVFMGTPEFSIAPLNALIKAHYNVVGVYSQPPRASGRGQRVQPSPVHAFAEKHAIDVYTPISLKSDDAQAALAALQPDIIVVVAYGLILPKAVLSLCPCVNIHASLLPRWRGAAPIHRAIMAGDTVSGVTIMQMDEGLDTGAMILKRSLPITNFTTGQLHDRLSDMGAELIVTALDQYPHWQLQEQEGEVSYAHKIDKKEAAINWTESVDKIHCHIRGLNPWPGAYTYYQGQKIKILEADYTVEPHSYRAGEVIDESFTIACDKGMIMPLSVQREGKQRMPICEFLKGLSVSQGTIVQ